MNIRDIKKYPRTQHVKGSRIQHGDHDLESVHFSDIRNKNLVVEEKIDGANCGISFAENGQLLLQSRGHYLRGGPREKQFDLLKVWSATHADDFFCVLGTRYIMYGEWMYAKHTCYYDNLPAYFMEFDVLDTETNSFLSTPARKELLKELNVSSVHVIAEDVFDRFEDLTNLITRSNFITDQRQYNFLYAASQAGVLKENSLLPNEDEYHLLRTADWSPLMEGLYIKWEDNGIVKGRYKYVRDTFINSIADQEEHWASRPIIKNMLRAV